MIAGLGNPGAKYEKTRHNIGFMVLDEWAQQNRIHFSKKKWEAQYCEINYQDTGVLLIKPQTFMNLSGKSIQAAKDHYKIPLGNMLVIHDEIDLDFADMKMKEGGGHRGHNGIRDIKSRLGSGEFTRLRMGVGRPVNEHISVADYVLSNFSKDEMVKLPSICIDAVAMIETFLARD